MPNTPLSESVSGNADANGIVTVALGPLRSFETWQIRRITVSSASATLVPTAKIYRGAVSPSRLIDGTFTGTLDSTETLDLDLTSGDRIVGQWTGCDVGASCTLTLEGTAVK